MSIRTEYAGWTAELRAEFSRSVGNGQVGQLLLSETDRVRVWSIRLAPGERVAAHMHVLDYFWTAVTAGESRQHADDGTTREVTYAPGETQHHTFGPGEYLIHDLENIGTTELVFTTVEFVVSANVPLPLG